MPDALIKINGSYDGNTQTQAGWDQQFENFAETTATTLTFLGGVTFDNSGSSLFVNVGESTITGEQAFSSTQYLNSKGLTGSQGFTVGASNTKDMGAVVNYSVPAGGNPTGGALTLLGTSYKWSDWGGDIFDNWGYFYVYHNSVGVPINMFGGINGSDGSINTSTQTFNGLSTTVKQGYVATGLLKIEVSSTSTSGFRIGNEGGMGSDSNSSLSLLSHSASWGTLNYIKSAQTGSSTEIFYVYYIPKLKSDNDAGRKFNYGYHDNRDRLYTYTNADLLHGGTYYFSKTNDVKLWVANDIEISTSQT